MKNEEIAKYLTGLGYKAEFRDNSMKISTDKPLTPGTKDKVRNALRSVGYKGRWGWKIDKR